MNNVNLEFTKSSSSDEQVIIVAMLATILFTLLFFVVGTSSGSIVIINDFRIAQYFAILSIIIMSLASLLVQNRLEIVGFYLRSTSLLVFLSMTIISLHSLLLFGLSLIPLIAYSLVWVKKSYTIRSAFKKLMTFSAAMTFMYFAGSLLHLIIEPASYPTTFASISEAYVFNPTGVPLLLKYGFIFFSPYFQGTISPLSFIMFAAISAILTENYFSIFGLLKGGNGRSRIQGAAYGTISLLSCQCEGGISLLPTMAVLIISIAMVPILLESFFLLVMTNLFINRFYLRGKSVGVLKKIGSSGNTLPRFALAAILFLGTPLVETIGIYFGLISNMFFFFGIGILMTVASYYEVTLVGRLIGYSRKLHPAILSAFFIVASFFMFIWYVPRYTLLAIDQIPVFLIMNATSLISGFLFGIIRLSSVKSTGQLLDEFIALMFGMPPIVVFYFSALAQIQFWPVFSLTEQILFGLVIWALILPFMWLTTNLSLNDVGENFARIKTPILNRKIPDTGSE